MAVTEAGDRIAFFVDQMACESLSVAEASERFAAPAFQLYDPPNKALEPTLTVGPFSLMPSTLETFSFCE